MDQRSCFISDLKQRRKRDSRSGTILGLPFVLCFGSTRGAKDTEMIFLVSQLFGPVRVILVSCRKYSRKKAVYSLFPVFSADFIQ